MRHGMSTIVIFWLSALVPLTSEGGGPALPDSRLGVRTAPILLLSRPDVRADLQLDEGQAAEAEKVLGVLRRRAQELFGKQGAEAVSARRLIDQEQVRWIESNLSEDQQKRLVQVDLQWEGAGALVSRRAVSEALGLTSEQREALRKMVDTVRLKRAAGQYTAADDATLARQALAVLSDGQRQQWRSMLGNPFHPLLAARAVQAPR